MSRALLAFLGALALAVLSMGVWAAAGRRRDVDAERRGSQFLLGAFDFLLHWFLWAVGPLERASLRLGLTPDAFNVLGLLFGLASGVLVAMGRLELAGWAIVGGGVADVLDGRIARARNLSSPYGAFIDSTFDRFVEVFAFLGLVVFFHDRPAGAFLAAAAMAGSLLVSYTRARGESQGVTCKEGLMQRAERLVLLLLVCFFDRPLTSALGRPRGTAVVWVLALIAAGTFATAAYRTVWIARRLRR